VAEGITHGERPRLITPAFLLIASASLAYFTSAGITLPAVPLYVKEGLGGNRLEVGIAMSMFAFAALAVRPFVGRLGDRRGRRPLMIIGGLVVGGSVLGYGVADSVLSITLWRLVSGAGEAFFFTGASVAIADLAPEERRGEAVSFFSLALYIGIGIGPFIGELLIETAGFGWTWGVTAALAVASGLVALRIPETKPVAAGPPVKTRLIHPAAILPGVVLLASVSAQAGFISFVPLYARRIGLSGSGFVFILYSGIVVLIRSVGARIPDRVGPVRASRLAMAFAVAGMAVVALWRSSLGLALGTGVFAVGSALAFPALFTLALRGTDPAERARVLATVGAFIDLAFGLGPAVLGALAEGPGYAAAFLSAGGIAAAGLALLLGAYRATGDRRRDATV
jgi:MFS family permease